jgi:hypothetical protein
MTGAYLSSSFGATLAGLTWVGLPLYAAAVGLALAHTRPHTTDEGARPEIGGGPSTLLAQMWLMGGGLALMALFRGYEGPAVQGQLALSAPAVRLQAAAAGLGFLGLGLVVPAVGPRALANPALGLRIWALAPLTMALWGLLPLVTHLTTALLVLEMVGAGLV